MTRPPRMSEIVQGIEASRFMLREMFDLADERTMHDLLAELEALLNEHALNEELAMALALRVAIRAMMPPRKEDMAVLIRALTILICIEGSHEQWARPPQRLPRPRARALPGGRPA
jgi:hypothetical protein